MGSYSIKDLEYLSGIKAHTIRIWEQRYNIISPERTCTNIRTYSDADLKHILNVSFLNHNGIKISKIASLSASEIMTLVESISVGKADYPVQVSTLILSMVNLDEIRFNQVLKLQNDSEGFEQTALNILLPFLERVGILWMTGGINPAQEHFISGLIRQKLLAAIDDLPVSTDTDKKKFILFLPEGEWHEIGLLFACFLIKKRGFRVVYLGQSLPLNDLIDTISIFNPDVLVSAITTYPSHQKLIDYIQILTKAFAGKEIILSGTQVLKIKEEVPKSVTVIETIYNLIDYLDKMPVSQSQQTV